MAQLNDTHKQERNSNYFGIGIYEVLIESVDFATDDKGREFATVNVLDKEDPDRTDTPRLWFHTDGAITYSFGVLRDIFVHNQPTEEKKNEIREKLNSLDDTQQLAKACEALKGKECWYAVYADPKRKYEAGDGTMKPSINKNLYGYEPTNIPAAPSTEEVAQAKAAVGGDEITTENVDQVFPDFS